MTATLLGSRIDSRIEMTYHLDADGRRFTYFDEPRQFLRPALECGASAMVVFHTHPSGDPAPSAADLAVTRQLREAAEILGIALLDHLILGSGRQFVSLQKRGVW